MELPNYQPTYNLLTKSPAPPSNVHPHKAIQHINPDPLEDLESRSPNLGPYTTKGTL